jgi:hypothetical protein
MALSVLPNPIRGICALFTYSDSSCKGDGCKHGYKGKKKKERIEEKNSHI